ncbi:hypothetical protein ACTAQI_13565 [Pseudarthrobacter sp. alpha12b]
MGELVNQASRDLTGLPPVYVDVPDKSGMPGAGTTRLLNTGLTEAEAMDAAEPAPAMFATTGQQRRHAILGVSWIVPWLIAGGLLSVYSDAARYGQAEDAGRALIWLAVLVPCGIAFGAYRQWRNRHRRKDYEKRHQAWVARFVGNWPLRNRLVDVDAVPDIWQRVSTKTMADTLEADRAAILAQGMPARPQAATVLAEALAAVGAWARAPWSDPALYRAAQQTVDRFGELAGRRRADAEPSGPTSNLP